MGLGSRQASRMPSVLTVRILQYKVGLVCVAGTQGISPAVQGPYSVQGGFGL